MQTHSLETFHLKKFSRRRNVRAQKYLLSFNERVTPGILALTPFQKGFFEFILAINGYTETKLKLFGIENSKIKWKQKEWLRPDSLHLLMLSNF